MCVLTLPWLNCASEHSFIGAHSQSMRHERVGTVTDRATCDHKIPCYAMTIEDLEKFQGLSSIPW